MQVLFIIPYYITHLFPLIFRFWIMVQLFLFEYCRIIIRCYKLNVMFLYSIDCSELASHTNCIIPGRVHGTISPPDIAAFVHFILNLDHLVKLEVLDVVAAL